MHQNRPGPKTFRRIAVLGVESTMLACEISQFTKSVTSLIFMHNIYTQRILVSHDLNILYCHSLTFFLNPKITTDTALIK